MKKSKRKKEMQRTTEEKYEWREGEEKERDEFRGKEERRRKRI